MATRTNNTLLIAGGHVVDPTQQLDGPADVLIKHGKIASIGKNISANGAKRLDASGKLVLPGLIDVHVHSGRHTTDARLDNARGRNSTKRHGKQLA